MPKNLNRIYAHLRREYASGELTEKNIARSPMAQFKNWFAEAVRRKTLDANAFVLATANLKSLPSARVLLMKGLNQRGITFFTNYESDKAKDIDKNPQGAAVFFWNKLNRQIRLEGKIVKLSQKASMQYFFSRPLQAQIAACVSDQSRAIANRFKLEEKFTQLQKKLGKLSPDFPENWGGYELLVERAEFWQGRPNRLHDRLVYSKAGSRWKIMRLQP